MKPRRKICDFTTSRQRIAKVKANGSTSIKIGATNTIEHGRIELDTHADTIVFGHSLYYYPRHNENVTCRLILMSMKQSRTSHCLGRNSMDVFGISGNFHHNPA